ncbi:spindle and kinetochore-associated protein 2 [Nematostella vectensis]|uniref:spindle and kinetochore-associated protein 2 n=1 Tax=Nematostella vectensis TaxID=45351 RepID=UPI00207784CE|nr:spindle and kinetochore-associated protein 2 [Nematostella vectensis]
MESAIDKLEALLQKTDSDLNVISLRLDTEFSQQFAKIGEKNLNPVKLLERINKAKHDFKLLQTEMMEISKRQKDVQAELTNNLVPMQQMIQALQIQTGLEVAERTEEEAFLRNIAPSTALSQNAESYQKDDEKENNRILENTENLEIKRNLKEFIPVTEAEFNSVSELIRGRVKLDAVNKVHETLFEHFKKNKKSSPLMPQDMFRMGLKVTGTTGEAKLKVLRALKIISISNKGAVKWQS